MEIGRRKGKSIVATGSIWESRMIIDQVKGGIKVFNGDSNSEEPQHLNPKYKISPPNPKRKTWNSQSTHTFENSLKKSSIHTRITSDASPPSVILRSEKSTVDTTKSWRKPKSEGRRIADFNMKNPKGSATTCLNLKEVDAVEENMKNFQEREQSKQVIFAENIPMKLMKSIKKTFDSSITNRRGLHSEDDSKVSHDKAMQTSLCHNNFMDLADLVMWRDSSRSALVFVVGTFFTLLSSYTDELNISFFTVLCYVGILYIAAMYLYKTITGRSEMDVKSWSESYIVSEEEAIRLLKLVLPYINRFVFNIGCLFSGDPITTIKVIACHNG